MTISIAVLQPGIVLTTSAVAVVTSAPNTHSVIKRAVCSNITAGSVTVTISRLAVGGGALVIVPARSISTNGTDLLPELTNMVLNPGDIIEAQASANTSINFFASGYTQ